GLDHRLDAKRRSRSRRDRPVGLCQQEEETRTRQGPDERGVPTLQGRRIGRARLAAHRNNSRRLLRPVADCPRARAMSESEEVLAPLDKLQQQFEDLAAGGLGSVETRQTTALRNQADALKQMSADHLASQIEAVLSAVERNDRSAAALLMRAHA